MIVSAEYAPCTFSCTDCTESKMSPGVSAFRFFVSSAAASAYRISATSFDVSSSRCASSHSVCLSWLKFTTFPLCTMAMPKGYITTVGCASSTSVLPCVA